MTLRARAYNHDSRDVAGHDGGRIHHVKDSKHNATTIELDGSRFLDDRREHERERERERERESE